VRLAVRCEPAIAWAVLTDYENLFHLVPGMRRSRIVSVPGEPRLLA
jgi:hypothetical protein